MDAYSYTDIFDTKGIEYLVVIAFLLVLIPAWIVLNRKVTTRPVTAARRQGISLDALRIMPGLLYSRNHTWSHLARNGIATFGTDDLLLHLTGGVSVEYLKKAGEEVRKGEPVAAIVNGSRSLKITAPFSGKIESLNAMLTGKPGKVNADPYNQGWIARVKPDAWIKETSGAFLDQEAKEWMEQEYTRSKAFFADELQPETEKAGEKVMQTGGELVEGPLESMPEETWKRFQQKFLD